MMEQKHLLRLIEAISESRLTYFSLEEEGYKLTIKSDRETEATGGGGSSTAGMPLAAGFVQPPAGMPLAPGVLQSNVGMPVVQPAVPEELPGNLVKCPLVGTFYSAAAPGEKPFVRVGDTVHQGQVLGIVEAMKLMNEITCEYDGVVKEILVEDQQLVEYGQPLFRIE